MDKNKQYESKDKMVSHPDHYQSDSGIEVIDVIKAFTSDLKGIEATDTGNIIKYACRWNKKGKPIQDVEKIIWYATHLLNELKNSKTVITNEKMSAYERCIKEYSDSCKLSSEVSTVGTSISGFGNGEIHGGRCE